MQASVGLMFAHIQIQRIMTETGKQESAEKIMVHN